jgi:cardiolipin synthase A/B
MRGPIALIVCACLAGCAAVPKVNDAPSAQASPQIVGARGPLTAAQSKALLDRIAPEPGDNLALKRHAAIEQAVAETPLVAGNSTRILIDGDATFAAMFEAIARARKTLNLEYYILEDVESGGRHLGDLLVAKRQEGVAINIIYDSYGSAGTPSSFFQRLKDAGINLVDFNPVNPLDPITLNKRDHRKILVADGALAIVGGVNLSTEYETTGSAKSGAVPGKPNQRWRDTDLQIEGPAVAALQTLFLEHWSEQKGPALERDAYFPALSPKGTEVVRIVGSTPDKEIPRFYVTLLSAIRNADKNVWLSAAYFVPTDQEEEDLIGAARRGVDVRLLLPSDSDSKMALRIGRSHYGYLLEAGVKIYEIQDAVLHSKTASIDGVWTAIGSSNFDPRSVVFNDEVDAIVLGSATADDLARQFEADMAAAKQIDAAAWRRRPLGERVLELFGVTSYLWQNWF